MRQYSPFHSYSGNTVSLTLTELRTTARLAYEIVDKTASAVIQLVESTNYCRIACRRGCHDCCYQFVGTTLAEAVLIADWLRERKTDWRLKQYREKFTKWRNTAGSIAGLMSAKENPLDEGVDSSEVKIAVRQYWDLQLICPFNTYAGSCQIYPVRPLACRVLFVTGAAEYCRWGQAREPILLWHPKLNEVTGIARSMLLGASAMAGCSHRLALPEAVNQALAPEWQAKGDQTITDRIDAGEGGRPGEKML